MKRQNDRILKEELPRSVGAHYALDINGEMERYKQLNAEFQRIARRDKNDFLKDQYKQIE